MKDDDLIERIWREAPEERTVSEEQIFGALMPRVDRGSRVLRRHVWTYLLIQVGTLALAGANLVGYRSNPTMLSVEIGVALAALGFAAHGVRLHGQVSRLERVDETLEAVLRRRLAFYGSSAPIWMWAAAFSVVGLTFALNSLIDNVDGTYAINKPVVFVGVQMVMVLALVGSFRLAHEPYLVEMRAMLEDLHAQVLDRTAAVQVDLTRLKNWRIALVVFLAAIALLGVWVAWRSFS